MAHAEPVSGAHVVNYSTPYEYAVSCALPTTSETPPNASLPGRIRGRGVGRPDSAAAAHRPRGARRPRGGPSAAAGPGALPGAPAVDCRGVGECTDELAVETTLAFPIRIRTGDSWNQGVDPLTAAASVSNLCEGAAMVPGGACSCRRSCAMNRASRDVSSAARAAGFTSAEGETSTAVGVHARVPPLKIFRMFCVAPFNGAPIM